MALFFWYMNGTCIHAEYPCNFIGTRFVYDHEVFNYKYWFLSFYSINVIIVFLDQNFECYWFKSWNGIKLKNCSPPGFWHITVYRCSGQSCWDVKEVCDYNSCCHCQFKSYKHWNFRIKQLSVHSKILYLVMTFSRQT